MNNHKPRLLISTGGTGGHIFPGIAIAEYLTNHGWHILWIGTDNRMEANLVPKYNIAIEFIRFSSFRGKNVKNFFYVISLAVKAIFQTCNIINIWKPDVVLGMGGYVSGPCILAAWILRIPILIHEQNAIAGLTNRLLAIFAKKRLQAFPGVLKKAIVVGNPIRYKIRLLPHPQIRFLNRKNNSLRVLILGGSQGSYILNKIIPELAMIMGKKITLWHQVGKESLYKIKKNYQNIYNTKYYRITEFIEDIAEAYAWADIVICRAGALTVSEISAVGIAAIFVPFNHRDKQQYLNALPLKKIGAANILEEKNFSATIVAKILTTFNRKKLLRMAVLARTLAIVDSTERVASAISYVVNSSAK
ncbi:MAG: undecaprenyldiphospho-muramoylpentapeptide beta-N-acetylglucosaminyltransferase [Candidatus Dasytiphilus stammeri]